MSLIWRWTRRALLGLGALLVVTALAGATYERIAAGRRIAATPPPGRLVDVGGHELHIWCTGAGSPAVILETGLGGSFVDWGFVQPVVAQFTRVCSYDRAGLGYSDPGPSPRTARRIAGELAALLERSGVAGPFVLVGASSGGFSVRIFASDRPQRVSGLVLVDASHEDQGHVVPTIARFVPTLASLGVLRALRISFGRSVDSLADPVRVYGRAVEFRAAGYRAAADEMLNIQASADDVRANRRQLSAPLVVVSGALGADDQWRGLQRDQLKLSSRSCQIVAEQSGHAVPVDQPQVVVDAIRAVVDAASGIQPRIAACNGL